MSLSALFFLPPPLPPSLFAPSLKAPRLSALRRGMRLRIRLQYRTSSEASGVQWLQPEQTAGKTHPYLFTQCQAIHARSVMPCQDTPAHKCTYTASVTVPAPLTGGKAEGRRRRGVGGPGGRRGDAAAWASCDGDATWASFLYPLQR